MVCTHVLACYCVVTSSYAVGTGRNLMEITRSCTEKYFSLFFFENSDFSVIVGK